MVRKEKLKGLDLYIVDLVDKDKTTTRFYISAKTLYVRWLEYEEPGGSAGPIKYVPQLLRLPRRTGHAGSL